MLLIVGLLLGVSCFNFAAKKFFQETVGKEKFPTISACLAALLNCWVSACVFFFVASFLRLRLPSFWKLVAAVCFMLILPELFQFTRIQANRAVAQSDEWRRLIKAYIRTYILSDPRRSRLSLRSGALSLTQTAPLLQSSVVDFCCRA